MLDFGFAELGLIMLVIVLAVGPQEIPKVMVSIGRMARRLSYAKYAMSQQFDQYMREADLNDIRAQVNFEEDAKDTQTAPLYEEMESIEDPDPLDEAQQDAIAEDILSEIEDDIAEDSLLQDDMLQDIAENAEDIAVEEKSSDQAPQHQKKQDAILSQDGWQTAVPMTASPALVAAALSESSESMSTLIDEYEDSQNDGHDDLDPAMEAQMDQAEDENAVEQEPLEESLDLDIGEIDTDKEQEAIAFLNMIEEALVENDLTEASENAAEEIAAQDSEGEDVDPDMSLAEAVSAETKEKNDVSVVDPALERTPVFVADYEEPEPETDLQTDVQPDVQEEPEILDETTEEPGPSETESEFYRLMADTREAFQEMREELNDDFDEDEEDMMSSPLARSPQRTPLSEEEKQQDDIEMLRRLVANDTDSADAAEGDFHVPFAVDENDDISALPIEESVQEDQDFDEAQEEPKPPGSGLLKLLQETDAANSDERDEDSDDANAHTA